MAFLSLIFVGALGIDTKLRLAPLFTETFVWLETSMPVLQFSSGGVTSATPGPLRLEHPKYKEVAVIIDTARKDPVTAQQMADAKVLAYLSGNALYMERGQGQIETIDLSKSAPERATTVDAATYKGLELAFDWMFYPAWLLFFFLTFAGSIAVCGLLYGLAGLAFASLAGGSLRFPELFRVAVHAQTAGCLLYSLDALLPVSIPLILPASASLSLTFLWLGVRAAVKPAPESPSAPPPAAA